MTVKCRTPFGLAKSSAAFTDSSFKNADRQLMNKRRWQIQKPRDINAGLAHSFFTEIPLNDQRLIHCIQAVSMGSQISADLRLEPTDPGGRIERKAETR